MKFDCMQKDIPRMYSEEIEAEIQRVAVSEHFERSS